MCFFAVCVPSLVRCLFTSVACVLIGVFVFLLNCRSSLFWIRFFIQIYALQVFSSNLWCFCLLQYLLKKSFKF